MEGFSTNADTLANIDDVEVENDYEVQELPIFNQGDYLSSNLIYQRNITLADVNIAIYSDVIVEQLENEIYPSIRE